MTRTYDLIKEKPGEKSEPLRLSDIENLKSEEDGSGIAVMQGRKDLEDAEKMYINLQNFMRELREKVTNNQPLQFETALSLIHHITESRNTSEKMYQLTIAFGHEKDYYISHPINAMVYAIMIGWHMGYSHIKLTELALSALLHDIGMFMIPEDIFNKKESLSESELALVKRHPDMGKNCLFSFKDDFPWLARAVHEHHERENGQGYPRGIIGDDIIEYAKIIGICDSYEAMTHNRPHKKAIMQFASVRELIETKNLSFSPKILKIFLEEISLYPTGSYVKLNNMSIGRVIATNKDQPLKPIIKILFDGHGGRVTEERIINLKENTVLNILSGISETEFPH
jgi:HD-GYP domain-containing protein (c-di-GMP phosphodiesterase class II)